MANSEVNWGRVARHLKGDAEDIRERAISGFPNDHETQREMRTRAAILDSIAEAIWAGLE